MKSGMYGSKFTEKLKCDTRAKAATHTHQNESTINDHALTQPDYGRATDTLVDKEIAIYSTKITIQQNLFCIHSCETLGFQRQ